MDRYTFTNWSDKPFTGRFGGTNYEFAPGESRQFDPDKHYMLIVLSKQLADRELIKGIHGVGRDPNNQETWGRALGVDGKPWEYSVKDRKELMKRAIGDLVETPVPTPDQEVAKDEAGATKEGTEKIAALTEKVEVLTSLVEKMAAALAPKPPAAPEVPVAPVVPSVPTVDTHPLATKPNPGTEPHMGMARDVLFEMAVDMNLGPHEGMSKEELVEAISRAQTPPATV